jgi:hypothetical protein
MRNALALLFFKLLVLLPVSKTTGVRSTEAINRLCIVVRIVEELKEYSMNEYTNDTRLFINYDPSAGSGHRF